MRRNVSTAAKLAPEAADQHGIDGFKTKIDFASTDGLRARVAIDTTIL